MSDIDVVVDTSRARRLKEARENMGYPSAAAAARQLNIPESTYREHENGRRPIGIDEAVMYSREFRVTLTWLATGEHPYPRDPELAELISQLSPHGMQRILPVIRAVLRNAVRVERSANPRPLREKIVDTLMTVSELLRAVFHRKAGPKVS
jgi:DNA-binding XRE family transcriptional regulator